MSNAFTSSPLARLTAAFAALAFLLLPARASINLFPPGQNWNAGTDGVFAPTANVVVDLSQAPTGTWDQDNTANAGKGVYDPAKWAVVFKYSSLNIPVGVTVTFKNHFPNAPVVWLVNGDAMIAGTVDLSGQYSGTVIPADPGPGGFRGGFGPLGQGSGGWGFGPGGGGHGDPLSGIYSYPGQTLTYGNELILPLIGGSGAKSYGSSGASGGGAILIACTGTANIGGTIRSLFGGYNPYGSAGAIRLVASALAGSGTLDAYTTASASGGRLRVESLSDPGTLHFSYPIVVDSPSDPVTIWPPADAPTIRVVSVGAYAVPADPKSGMGPAFSDADIKFNKSAAQTVTIATTNVDPSASKVTLLVTPKQGPGSNLDVPFASGDSTSALWTVQLSVPFGFTAMQARVDPK